jgi:predicted acylesterase/phospholipase RssA
LLGVRRESAFSEALGSPSLIERGFNMAGFSKRAWSVAIALSLSPFCLGSSSAYALPAESSVATPSTVTETKKSFETKAPDEDNEANPMSPVGATPTSANPTHRGIRNRVKLLNALKRKKKNRSALTTKGLKPPSPAIDDSGVQVRPIIGLALGGGGTRGAAHVGVLRVLEEEGIPIDCIAGTSMGAIVGGLYSAGVPLDTIQKTFDNGKLMHSYMTVPLFVRILAAPILLLPRLVGYHSYDGLYNGNKFRKFLNKMTPSSEDEIQELNIPFSAVALDIRDGKRYSLTKGPLGYALQASSAVPVLRKPVQIGDQLFVDGGAIANVPVNEVKAMGPDIVIAVDVDERVENQPLEAFRKVGSVSRRMILLELAEMDSHQISGADVVIHPNVDGIGLISTNIEEAKRAIKAGEDAARAAIPAIRAKLGLAPQVSLNHQNPSE